MKIIVGIENDECVLGQDVGIVGYVVTGTKANSVFSSFPIGRMSKENSPESMLYVREIGCLIG